MRFMACTASSSIRAVFKYSVGQYLKQSHNKIRKNLNLRCTLQYCLLNSTRSLRMGQGIEIERDPSTGIGYILDKNPSDGSLLQKVPCSTRGEINAKIESLQEKQTKWSLVPLEERVQLLRNAVKHLLVEKDDLAILISQEMGKTLPESRAELDDIGELTGTSLDLMKQANEPQVIENACIIRDPLGVVAILSPWNFPAAEIIFHLLPALVAGNAVIVKPSEVVPLVGQFVISKLLQYSVSSLTVTLPIDIVQGDGEVGEALVMHEGIHAICMTGSSAVGKKVMENCGKRLKRVILELGGKDPMIVFRDADLNLAAKDAVTYSTCNAGQVCCSIERIYVDQQIKRQFEELCVQECQHVKAGPFDNAESVIGPMVSELQRSKVDAQVRDAISHGARILYTGDILTSKSHQQEKHFSGNTYYPATVITDLTHEMEITKEETFGPVVAIYEFDGSEEQAIKLANSTNYGLTASVYGQDMEKCQRVSGRIRAGQVGINTWSILDAPKQCPFVGHKESGMGYHSGSDGYRQYSVPKSIVLKKRYESDEE